jgi:hypothetical protein
MRQRWRRPERPRAGGCEAMAGRVGVNRRNPVLGGPFVPRRLAATESVFRTIHWQPRRNVANRPPANSPWRTTYRFPAPSANGDRRQITVGSPTSFCSHWRPSRPSARRLGGFSASSGGSEAPEPASRRGHNPRNSRKSRNFKIPQRLGNEQRSARSSGSDRECPPRKLIRQRILVPLDMNDSGAWQPRQRPAAGAGLAGARAAAALRLRDESRTAGGSTRLYGFHCRS